MDDSRLLKILEALPALVLISWAKFIGGEITPLLVGSGFLAIALLMGRIAFVGDKKMELRFGNKFRGPYFLLGCLLALIALAYVFSEGWKYSFEILLVGVLSLFYYALLGKMFSHAMGTKESFGNFFGHAMKLFLISFLGVLIIGSIAFALVLFKVV